MSGIYRTAEHKDRLTLLFICSVAVVQLTGRMVIMSMHQEGSSTMLCVITVTEHVFTTLHYITVTTLQSLHYSQYVTVITLQSLHYNHCITVH